MSADTLPKPSTDWFVADRFGMFIHWGLYALPARHEWVQNREKIRPEDYRRYFQRFDPDLYDPRQWAKMARRAGMKYFVITTKHHEGFCLWDSKFTDYKAPKTPAGRDLLKPMVEAFRDEGLKIGFYYSLIDWHHPDFTIDRVHPLREDEAARAENAGRDMKRYAKYMRDQVRELLTEFGRIDLLWFDFSYPGEDGKGRDDWESEKLYAMVRELQPHVLVDNRLDLPGVGDFLTPEQFQPPAGIRDESGKPAVWEACQTLSGSWGYHRDEMTWKSVEQLLWMLIDGVSKGGNLLLNVGPTGRGEFDDRARDRLEGVARWMHHHSRSIHGCGAAPEGLVAPADSRYTYNAEDRRLYLHLFNWPYRHILCPGLVERIEYAQFLHDASEVRIDRIHEAKYGGVDLGFSDMVALHLPVIKPKVEVPVIEIFLKG
ncbi:MAG: alpha-L-fucosidase [Phycisphaeraceae bacterium]|nr:alpha-L-fucosidase [Phycisphaeraceae bacterium]